MKKTISLIISLCMLLSTFAIGGISAPAEEIYNATVNVTYKQSDARSILPMINEMRTSSKDAWYWDTDNKNKIVCSGLEALTYDYSLEKVAMQRAAEIAVSYSHTRPDNTSCFSASDDANLPYYSLGENIAAGYTSAEDVNLGWREDNDKYDGQGHRRNMLSSYFNCVGIACVTMNGVKYWVEEFAYLTTLDTHKTTAKNSSANVSIRLAQSNIRTAELNVEDSLDIDISDTASLPVATANIVTNDFWGYYGATVKPECSYKVSGSAITVSDGKITPVKLGKATVTISALGISKKITVNVTCAHKYKEVSRTDKTCTKDGSVNYLCSKCGTEKTVILKAGHNFEDDITAATLSKNGKIVKTCSVCGHTEKETIYYPKSITLSSTSYVYNGKVKKPSVVVKDSKGNKISSDNYTVEYGSGRKLVGKYKVTIKFKNNYSGTKALYFTINPSSTSLSSLTAKSRGFTAKWKKQSTQTTGYQLQYSTKSDFSDAKLVTISKTGTTSKTVNKLKAKKKYYVRVRTYKTIGKTKYYSSWSKYKAVTTK